MTDTHHPADPIREAQAEHDKATWSGEFRMLLDRLWVARKADRGEAIEAVCAHVNSLHSDAATGWRGRLSTTAPQAPRDGGDFGIPVELPDGRIALMRKCDLKPGDMVAFVDLATLPPHADRAGVLPPLPGHPEPHTHMWTTLELACIEAYGRECFNAGRAAHPSKPADAPQATAGDFPLGAIVNGHTFAERLEATDFACEAGKLDMCSDWVEFRRCFDHLAAWAQQQTAEAPQAAAQPVASGWPSELEREAEADEWEKGYHVGYHNALNLCTNAGVAALANQLSATDVSSKVERLIACAWRWGESCGVDDIRSMQEKGDSHNEGLRFDTNAAKTTLLAVLAATPPAGERSTPAEPPAGSFQFTFTAEQVSAVFLCLLHDRKRPAYGWMEAPLCQVQALLKPVNARISDAGFNAMHAQFWGAPQPKEGS
jgi:hypothetical protein